MEKFACKDMGIDCGFTTTGATKAEVLKAALNHAQVAHKDMLSKLSPEQIAGLTKQIESKIKSA